MSTFEELGLSAPLLESLVSEGLERPTALQAHAIPVLRRGHSAILRGGPGAGLLVAWGAPLLDRVDPGTDQPKALILTPERHRAGALALSLARLALGSDHRVGALGHPWALPEHCSFLVSTPQDAAAAVRTARLKLDQVEAVVLDLAGALLEDGGEERVEALLSAIGRPELQIVLVGDPLPTETRGFIERHLRKAVFLPPEAAGEDSEAARAQAAPDRGRLEFLTIGEDPHAPVLVAVVARLLEEDHAHVLLYHGSEDGAADAGDYLALHGFLAGAAGDADSPVWLGIDPLEARAAVRTAMEAGRRVAVVSADPPTDADELDRRHGGRPAAGVVLVAPRELPHLRRVATEAGYSLAPLPPLQDPSADRTRAFLDRIDQVAETRDLLPWLVLLEPLILRRGAAEVAAALALLLREAGSSGGVSGGEPLSGEQAAGAAGRPVAWVRLFLSVGERDGIAARDLLGAIIGESGVSGDDIGRIDLRDTFSKVEVRDTVAERVIRALNGTSIRGRSVRADFDRGGDTRRRGDEGGGGSGGKRGGPGAGKGPRKDGGRRIRSRPEGGRSGPERGSGKG